MSWSEILETLVMLLVGLAGMPLTQWLKKKLGWQDLAVRFLAVTVAVGLGILELFLMGDLTFDMLTWANFANVFTAVFTVATIWFGLLKEGKRLKE